MSSTISLGTGNRQVEKAAEIYCGFSPAQQRTFQAIWNGAESELREQKRDYVATVPYKILNTFDFELLVGMGDGSWRLFYATVPLDTDRDGGDATLRVDVKDKFKHISRQHEAKFKLENILAQYK